MNVENTSMEGVIDINVEIKVEEVSENHVESDLYADHVIKDEMVIGPVVLQPVVYTTYRHRPEDVPVPKKPKLETTDEETDQDKPQNGMKEDNTEGIISKINTNTTSRNTKQTNHKCNLTPGLSENKIICNECGKQFRKKSQLSRHLLTHMKEDNTEGIISKIDTNTTSRNTKQTNHKCNLTRGLSENIFICNECGKQFRKKSQLSRHLLTHMKEDNTERIISNVDSIKTNTKSRNTKQTNQKCNQMPGLLDNVFICNECGEKFRKKCKLAKHVVSHQKEFHSDYKCKDSSSNISIHLRAHTEEKPYSCSHCDYKCKQKCSLSTHLLIHTREKPHSCSYCAYKCKRKDSLSRHLRTHTAEKQYSCFYCDYKCTRKSFLSTHFLTHTDEKIYSCSQCDYKCKRKDNLSKHLRIHTSEKPYSCSHCDYKCNQKGDLSKHLSTHTDEKPYSCSHCDFKCKRKDNLSTHIRTHTAEKTYSCRLCHYKCTQKGDLSKHLRTHTAEKPYSCSYCDYKCNCKSSLSKHLLIHTDKKPYSCSYCDYKCKRKDHLSRHLRVIRTHTNEKPYSCSYCDYKCNQKSDLSRHLRTHTGEKPFSCSYCEYKSALKSTLSRHLVRIHADEISK